MFKEPERKEAFYPKVSNYLADWSVKDWRKEVFDLGEVSVKAVNQNPDTSLLAAAAKRVNKRQPKSVGGRCEANIIKT